MLSRPHIINRPTGTAARACRRLLHRTGNHPGPVHVRGNVGRQA